MRHAVVAHLALAAVLSATSATAQATLPSAPLQQGLITASLPPPGAQPPSRPDLFRAGPETYKPRTGRRSRPASRFVPCCGPAYGPLLAPRDRSRDFRTPSTPYTAPETVGYLRLLTDVGDARVYVDSAFVGMADDFRSGAALEPGRHRVEVRATGYRSVLLDVRIEAGDVVTREADLSAAQPVAAPAPAARSDAAPSTFYVIPGCYAGDRPPEPDDLPSDCEIEQLRRLEI